MEQIDYGINQGARGSSSIVLKVEGGMLAIALALIALGAVVVAAIILPQMMESKARASVLEVVAPIQAKVAAIENTAYFSEREAKLAREYVNTMQQELLARGLIKNIPH